MGNLISNRGRRGNHSHIPLWSSKQAPPTRPLSDLIAFTPKHNDDIAIDRPQRTNTLGAYGVGHRADHSVERRAEKSLKVATSGFREVGGGIKSFSVEISVGGVIISCLPSDGTIVHDIRPER